MPSLPIWTLMVACMHAVTYIFFLKNVSNKNLIRMLFICLALINVTYTLANEVMYSEDNGLSIQCGLIGNCTVLSELITWTMFAACLLSMITLGVIRVVGGSYNMFCWKGKVSVFYFCIAVLVITWMYRM